MGLYLLAHAVTLSIISAILLVNILPLAWISNIPFVLQVRYQKSSGRHVCQELGTGIGGDERWYNDCALRLDSLFEGAMWVGMVLMTAQWLVLASVGSSMRWRPMGSDKGNDMEKRRELNIDEK